MLPGVGGGELVVIAVVALIVVGPKDLPKLLRQLGRFVGKMRAMADDFRSSFEDMARQSELDELRKEVEALRNPKTLPGLEDVHNELKTIGTDINDRVRPDYSTPDFADAGPVAEPIVDRQMSGLPPLETSEVADVVVKKPRTRKAKPVIDVETVADAPAIKPVRKKAPRKTAAPKAGSAS